MCHHECDHACRERDTLRLKVGELQATLSGIETKHELIHQELDRLTKEVYFTV